MSDGNVEIKVGKELIEPIIRAKINAAIIDALGDPEALLSHMVNRAMQTKVNENGKIDKYSSYNKYDFVEVLCKKEIHKAVVIAVREWITSHGPQIEKAVAAHMNRKTNPFAKALVSGLKEACMKNWTFDVVMKLPNED
jgi:hypothetical protein